MSKQVEAPVVDHFLQRVMVDLKDDVELVGIHPISTRHWSLLNLAPRRPLENPNGLATFSTDRLNELASSLFAGFEPHGRLFVEPAWYDGFTSLYFPRVRFIFPRDGVISMEHSSDPDHQQLSKIVHLPEGKEPLTGNSVIQVDILPHALIGPSIFEQGQNLLMPVDRHSRAIPLRSVATLQNLLASAA